MSYLLKSATDDDGNKILADSGIYADSGVLELRTEQSSSPSAPADGAGGKLYTKADGKLFWVSNEISEIEVSRELVITNASSTNADHYVTFVGATAATQALNTEANIKYNPSTQVLSVPNLTVTGTTTTVNSTVVSIADPILQLGGNASDDNLDRGLVLLYNDGSAKKAFMGYDDSDGKFAFLTAATDTSNVFTGTKATLKADIEGTLTGNAATATKLETVRTIGGVSFDGSANINLPGVNAVGSQNTTGSAATLTTARTIGGVSFDGSANINLPGVNAAGSQNTTGSAATLTTARTIGGVSFDGSANINLPGVNASGTQDTSGNSATATALATARTIGGVSFDGSANINLPGVNAVGSQNTTGSAATLTTARTIGGVSFDGSANINLPGVNAVGSQNTTGSAATLTTARTIGGVSFDGSANINLPGVNASGTQDTSGNAATATTAGTVTTAAQSNITSLGTLTSLTVDGGNMTVKGAQFLLKNSSNVTKFTINNNGNTSIEGSLTAGSNAYPTNNGSNGQFLKTNGSGTLSWDSVTTGNAPTVTAATTTTNANHYLAFTSGTSGAQSVNVDTTLLFNPSTDTLSVPNLTVTGTTTTVNSTTVTVADPILQLGSNASDDNLDRGLVMLYNDGSAKKAFMGYDDSDGKFAMLTAATDTSNVFTGTKATLKANLDGSAATLTTARTIGGVSFDGSANINLPGVNASGTQDTSGNAATATSAVNGVVSGILSIGSEQSSSPSAPSDGAGGKLYTKADGKPYWISNELSETDLSGGGGGVSGGILAIDSEQSSTPSAPSDGAGGKLYTKADGKPYWISNELSETDLSATGGGGGGGGSSVFTTSGSNIYWNGSGNMGVGTTSPAVKLDIRGHTNIGDSGTSANLTVYGNVQWTSDNRYKHNITPIENGLRTIEKLNPVTYFRTPEMRTPGSFISNIEGLPREAGLIAQEIADLPELEYLVKQDSPTKAATLNYTGVFTYLIKAVQELSAQNKKQQRQIQDLSGLLRPESASTL